MVGGDETGTPTLENTLASSCKVKLVIHSPYDPEIPIVHIYPREMNLSLYKNLYETTYSGLIHNFPKLEITQMSFNWQMDKQTVIHPYTGIFLGNEKEIKLMV